MNLGMEILESNKRFQANKKIKNLMEALKQIELRAAFL